MKRYAALFVSVATMSALPAFAFDLSALEEELDVNPVESCNDGLELYQEGDLKGALELITLCRDEMSQINEQRVSAAFVDNVMDFVGDPLRHQNAMGFSQMERKYRKDNLDIDVALSTGQGATMMQSLVGVAGKKTRIGKFSGYVISQGNDNTFYIPLDGMALSIKSRTVEQKQLKQFAKAFMKGFPE
ncbi:MAG: hypothetical protein AAF434_10045 [Pseudomonadota bacterium]